MITLFTAMRRCRSGSERWWSLERKLDLLFADRRPWQFPTIQPPPDNVPPERWSIPQARFMALEQACQQQRCHIANERMNEANKPFSKDAKFASFVQRLSSA
jgi:hypothetical protein